MSTFQIDVKKVLEAKAPLLAKIPFFVAWLKKTVHEDGVNECIRVCGHAHGTAFAAQVVEFFGAKINVERRVPLDPNGRYIFVANHPLGGLDGIAFVKAISEIYPELRFPVNDILMAIENFQPIFLPINKHGKQGREGVKLLEEAYASQDKQILMFPAGLASRKIDGKIMDVKWQKHFIKKAIQHKRDIVPVHIEGKNSNFFYRLANIRKKLGLPNIEMLYLPDEMFRQKNQTIKITIGSPISYQSLEPYTTEYATEFVKMRVYDLI